MSSIWSWKCWAMTRRFFFKVGVSSPAASVKSRSSRAKYLMVAKLARPEGGCAFSSARERFRPAPMSPQATRLARSALAGGLLSALGIGVVTYVSRAHVAGAFATQLSTQVLQPLLWSLFVWSWLLAVLYLGIRWLNAPNRAMRYAEESILPVYVIHPQWCS